ncbi:MAG: formylglycine-generating enzyme family protein [Planctomycetes bacterium]|nr:formylglycine-generating enzyme family protein [Planctomycetota bacterium]
MFAHLALALPTEARWERAARADTTTPWWTGGQKETLQGAGNLLDATVARKTNAAGRPYEAWLEDGYVYTAPVNTFLANPYGFHDMCGNVSQWCLDRYGPYTLEVRPGDGERLVEKAPTRVIRGASCARLAILARAAVRAGFVPDYRYWALGVRAARAIDP